MNSIIRNFIAKRMFQQKGAIANNKSVEFSANALQQRIKNLGIDPNTIKSEGELNQILSFVKQAEDQAFSQKFGNVLSGNKFQKKAEVVDLKNKKLDPEKPILGGTQETDEQILQRLKKQNEDSINRLKNKKDPPEELAGGGVAGLLGERTGFRGGGMDMGNESNQAQSASMGGSSNNNNSGGDNNYNYRGPADLGVTTRAVNRVTAPSVDTPSLDRSAIYQQYALQRPKKRNPIQKLYDTYNRQSIPVKILANLLSGGAPEIYQKSFQAGNVISGAVDRLNNPYYNEDEDMEGITGELGLADGGPARQNFAMGKRAFLKLMGGVGAGIAGLKSGLLGLGGKQATKKAVTETVKSAGSGTPPPYFFKLVEKIKAMGDDTPRLAVKDKENVTTYKDYTLTEDVVTGEKTIQRMKVTDDGSEAYYGQPLTEETYMSYKPGKSLADETTKGKTPPDEYEEGTAYLRSDRGNAGEIVDESFKISDDVIEEAMEETIKISKADGGRIGYSAGSKVIGKGIMSKINKLFGKGTMTTADKIAQPEKTIQQRIMEFEARNKPDAITVEPRQILDVPPMPKGFKLSREKLEKNYPELDEDMIDQIMELDKDMQGTVLTMLKNRRKDPDAYDKLLETKGDTLEFQGAFDKVTRRKNNATGGLANMLGE